MQHIINFTMGVRPVPTSNSGGKNKELEHGSRSGEFEDDLQDTDKVSTGVQENLQITHLDPNGTVINVFLIHQNLICPAFFSTSL